MSRNFFLNMNLVFFVPFIDFAVFTCSVMKIYKTCKVFITAFDPGKCLPHKNRD